jgi:predicted amidophosphoribosyltransferase
MGKRKVVSRQRSWQLKKIANGMCATCGNSREHSGSYCDKCAESHRLKMREKLGCARTGPTLRDTREPARNKAQMRRTKSVVVYLNKQDMSNLETLKRFENLRKSAAVSAALRWYVRSIRR